MQGEITVSGSSSSPSSSAKGGSAGGAIGMPAVSGGLLSAIAVTVAFLGGIARVMA